MTTMMTSVNGDSQWRAKTAVELG